MPFPNEHNLKIDDTSKYESFKRESNKFRPGIDAIIGVFPDKKTNIQSIRFRKSHFSIDEAEKWLSENKEFSGKIEPAKNDSLFRLDTFDIEDSFEETPEGFLKITANVSRIGVLEYKNLDGTIRRELRHPDHVFKEESLNTLKQKPVTNGHPVERRVDSKNVDKRLIGLTGEKIGHDGKHIKCNFLVTSPKGVKAIKGGRRKLSAGYYQDPVYQTGNYDGEDYDLVQTNIEYNHLSLCDNARGGNTLKINMDSYDFEDAIHKENKKSNKINNSNSNKGDIMPTLNIDGIDYEATQEVINSFNKKLSNIDSLTKELDTNKKALSTALAEKDSLKDDFEKFKTDSKENFNKKIKNRIEIEKIASMVFSAEDKINTDELTDIDLKKAIIIKQRPDSKSRIDSADDVYTNVSYDILIENLDKDIKDKKFSNQREKVFSKPNTDSNTKGIADKARDEMIERFKNASVNGEEK